MGCPYHFQPRMPGNAKRTSMEQTEWRYIAWKKLEWFLWYAFALFLSIEVSWRFTPRALASWGVTGSPMAAIISSPLNGRPFFLLHLTSLQNMSWWIAMLYFKRFAIQKMYFPHKRRHKQELDVVKVGKEPSTALIRCRFVCSPGFWDKSLLPKVKYKILNLERIKKSQATRGIHKKNILPLTKPENPKPRHWGSVLSKWIWTQ